MKLLSTIILALVLTMPAFSQTEVAGVELPNKQTFGQHEMMLNGAGVREKFWMDMYAGGLYVTEKVNNAQKVMDGDKPMAIKIHIVSGLISSKKMSDAVEEGFENSTKGKTEAYRKKIDQFKAFFSEEIQKQDVFDITYQPEKGIVVYKNNKKLGTIEGFDFKKALFGIWFCDEPADEDLMEGMLNL